MALLPFNLDNGLINPSAMYVNALLCSALYHEDRRPFDLYARIAGATVVDFNADVEAFQPDRGILTCGNDSLVVLSGTTNIPQWIVHLASSVWPMQDPITQTTCFGTSLVGLALIENDIVRALTGKLGGNVRVTGHSYGAGAAYILAEHLVYRPSPPASVSLMTLGEPNTYGLSGLLTPPRWHFRVITVSGQSSTPLLPDQVDPVTKMPPPSMMFFGFGKIIKLGTALFGLKWQRAGQAYYVALNAYAPANEGILWQVPFVADALLASDLLRGAALHLLDTGYLPRCFNAWKGSGLNPELDALTPFTNEYTGAPFVPPDQLRPPVPLDVINNAMGLQANPITRADLPNWDNLTSIGVFTQSPAGGTGGLTMTLMRGSFLNGIMEQGFSETFHSSNSSETYTTMQAKLAALLTFRANLTCTSTTKIIQLNQNLTSFPYWRVSDDLLTRDVLAGDWNTPASTTWKLGNLDGNLAAKVVWRNANNQQIAVTYLHGVPISSLVGGDTRHAVWSGIFTQKLTLYCNAISARGLGFNTINNNPANALGQITAVAYDAVSGNYTFTVANAVPQGKFRVCVRSMKSLRYLNGRWPAQSTGANTFLLFRPAANIVWDKTGSVVPLSGYNNFVPFSNYIVGVPATATPTLMCTRKLGKPFFLQRGRVTRRAAA